MPPNVSAATAPASLPTTLEGYRNHHAAETIIVCGCGSSLSSLIDPERFVTIGVNDVGRLFQPDYLVVLNPRSQFRGDRFHYVEHSQAKALFTHLQLGIRHPHIVRFNLGQRGGVDLSNPRALNYSRNSPYVAACLALHMGAKQIGVIGVDFTEHHFFAKTGVHPLTGEVRQIDAEYKRLYETAQRLGVEMYNLSAESRLTALPKIGLAEFSVRAKSREALRIVSYATTPVAGVPVVLGRSIQARTPHHGDTVWATNDYGNGVNFAGGVQWRTQPEAANALIEAADVVIMHNGKLDPRHRSLLAGRPVVTMAHNYLWNVDQAFVRQGYPGLVVAQYQAALPEFAAWTPIPNPVPLWEPAYRPESKGERVTICYTPSGKHDSYPKSHRLYWHSKGYGPTMRLLDRLAARYPLQLEVIRNQQISHAEALAMKRRAHIVIDECVTGSYHRNSLEGLAAGAVVVNGFGLLPEVVDVVRRCLPEPTDIPFVRANLDTLESVLVDLIEQGPERLAEAGRTNRLWMERYWDFSHQWERLWMPAIEKARERAGVPARRTPRPVRMAPIRQEPSAPPAQAAPAPPQPVSHEADYALSVVVPHGGASRYPLLEATLRQLERNTLAPEIVVVEMDRELRADALAREFAHRHVFVHSEEPFQLARARNIGIPFARGEYVLWLDSDLLVPPDFLGNAIEEISSRGLDCLIPWTAIDYLSQEDTNAVIAGVRGAQDCTPVNTFLSRRGVVGGAIMARKDFLIRFGGFDPGFRGWGGEDNGWLHKAQVLGRASVTNRQGQRLYHIFHEDSGGYGSRVQFSQPDYQRNVALLHRIRTIRTPSRFLQQFPPPRHFTAPWQGTRHLACAPEAARIAEALKELYGDAIVVTEPNAAADLTIDAKDVSGDLLDAALEAACRLSRSNAPIVPGSAVRPAIVQAEPARAVTAEMPAVREVDPEVAAFVHGRNYSPIQQFQLPFAVFHSHLGPMLSVVDCSIDSSDLGERILSLHPNAAYRRSRPASDGALRLPYDVPDGSVDRVICLDTFDRLSPQERRTWMAAIAGMLKPDGLLTMTSSGDAAEVDSALIPLCQKFGFVSIRRTSAKEIGMHLPSRPGAGHNDVVGLVLQQPDGVVARNARKLALGVTLRNHGANFASAWAAAQREASILARLGHPARLILGIDSTDGEVAVPTGEHGDIAPYRILRSENGRGGARLANRMIDCALESEADYLLLVDSEVILPPLITYSMLCHIEGLSGQIAWIAPDESSFAHVVAQGSVVGIPSQHVQTGHLLASVRLGLFRSRVFREGLRLDESPPFDRPACGYDSVDLSCQLQLRGYVGRRFTRVTPATNGSAPAGGGERTGIESIADAQTRSRYLQRKWRNNPEILETMLRHLPPVEFSRREGA